MRVAMPNIMHLYARYSRSCNFICVYIAEAHAKDEWPISSSRGSATGSPVHVAQHRTIDDRLEAARAFVRDYNLTQFPMVVDPIDNPFDTVFAAWPLRFYVVRDGILEFKAQPKDATYSFAHLEDHLRAYEASIGL